MRLKTKSEKDPRNFDLLRFNRLRNSLNRLEFFESMEVKSTIKDSVEVLTLRKLSGLPDSAILKVAGEIRPADAPAGFFALFEYPFKIGFKWPFSPLLRAFMTRFNLSSSQLMPQFWRVIQVIERVTKDWGRTAFSVNDLLTAYSVKPTDYDRYNAILERPWIHDMRAVPSTYHQKIKFPSPWGVQEIVSEKKIARECYKITMKTKSQDI
ncbi:hypothetical protein OSB04_016854 [Centaurea solstitialis]|uniref:Uncharacterized protein n=1 Tax=Centaurea solstitialis TaxID=347529 RepID=A0AA38T1T2_9ASTR|nr:hypothetical protein OSB04_016854 [Centaurea solstitialis]